MRRRDLLKLAATAALTAPQIVRAQTLPRRLGMIASNHVNERMAAFEQELVRQGWINGANLQLDYRNPGVDQTRVAAAVADVISLNPDVIVTSSTPVTLQVLEQTKSIPVVFVQVSDPVGSGIVQSMARPGGNATGFTNFEASVSGKWLNLLGEIVPDLVRPFMIFNPDYAISRGAYYLDAFQSAASAMGLEATGLPVQDAAEISPRIGELKDLPGAGLVVMPDNFNNGNRRGIVDACELHGIPAIYYDRVWAVDGGLIAYGVDVTDIFRRAADYAVRILQGAVPGELAVQGPSVFNLTLNLETARRQGITIPSLLMVLANETIG